MAWADAEEILGRLYYDTSMEFCTESEHVMRKIWLSGHRRFEFQRHIGWTTSDFYFQNGCHYRTICIDRQISSSGHILKCVFEIPTSPTWCTIATAADKATTLDSVLVFIGLEVPKKKRPVFGQIEVCHCAVHLTFLYEWMYKLLKTDIIEKPKMFL